MAKGLETGYNNQRHWGMLILLLNVSQIPNLHIDTMSEPHELWSLKAIAKNMLQLVLNKVTIFVSGTFLSQFQINFGHAFLLIQFYLERLLGKRLSQSFTSNIELIWAD